MLMHIPQILSAEDVQAMRQQLQASDDWVDGRETVGAQGAEVKRNLQLSQNAPLSEQLGRQVLAALARSALFHATALPLRILPPRFNRYYGGGTYGMHIDGSMMALGNGEHMRSDLSCTLFLVDPDEYDGGELVISDTYGEHDVKLPAGDLIVYPASSLHCVRPVTRGERLASFFWVQSMVRGSEQRRALLEMDTAITRLTETGADRPSVVQLTGVYHNLLRMWAQS